jgi:GntR family transcriptional regulator
MIMLNRPKPVSVQVKEVLQERILNEEFQPDGRLPSEAELASEFGVSRATIRTALSTLAAEGFITRRQGDGTYVNKHVIEVNTRLDSIWEFTEMIEASGRKATVEVLEAVRRAATPREASNLNVEADEDVLSLKRIFLADGRPLIYSTNVIPYNLICSQFTPDMLKMSILKFLEQVCAQDFAYAIADISAASATAYIAEAFQIAENTPLLHLEERFFNRNGLPLVYATNFCDDKTLRLRVVRSSG